MINKHDPEGLLALRGTDDDEYALEASDFAHRIRRGQEITPRLVSRVWEGWFGPGSEFVTEREHRDLEALATELDGYRVIDGNCPRCLHDWRLHPAAYTSVRLITCGTCIWEEDIGRREEVDMCSAPAIRMRDL